ncbi:ubiquinone biosynthesis protein [Evansella vedderi]|uniref:Ubiquinone biosynthesis protein n=2 Tax=Evansella vedderi TaxID=38282 RepID=A0ABU0A016_9BACI|nr:AarF/ABC1/UbiB kinase family protein [Evansella vedderi]MDQ0256830.1 ubiquinone biosynthesis protein [Evansella vedderi]
MGRRIRHIQRYRDIGKAFARNGFGFIAKELGLIEMLNIPKRLLIKDTREVHSKTTGERIRLFLEDLGPTFIKMGQLASTRPDIFPPDTIEELEKLQDQVTPLPFEEIKQVLELELNAPIETLFQSFHETPLATASIGQVHYAVLHSGESVAIKIQRPEISDLVKTDLEILQHIAILADSRTEWGRRYGIQEIINEFSKSLRMELDYLNEGRNAEKISKQFEDNKGIFIPKVFREYSSEKILTMEYIKGMKLSDRALTKENGFNRKIVADRFVHAIFHQILMEGFFHGDPHPGNIFVLPDNVVAFMDFGMVGRLTPRMKDHIASLIISMMGRNIDGLIKAITQMGVIPDEVNKDLLRADLEDLQDKYYDVPFSQISLGEAVNDLFSVAFEHDIRIPTDLTLLGKTLLTAEGITEKLDPEISIVKVAEPFGKRLLKERYHPKNIAEKFLRNTIEYGEMLKDLPRSVDDMTTMIKKGKLRMEFSLPDLERVLSKLDHISNRLSFSIVLLAFSIIMTGLIIGSSFGRQSTIIWEIPAIEIGFGVAAIMLIWLFYAIFKSGRF